MSPVMVLADSASQEEEAFTEEPDQTANEADEPPLQEEEADASGEHLFPTIALNEKQLEFDEPVIILHGRLMVPIRDLVETLDGEVVWDEEAQHVLITSSLEEEIVFQSDHDVLVLNGAEYRMDAAAINLEGRIYVPLRHAAQFLHTEVVWDEATYTADLVPVEPHAVQAGESLETISEELRIDQDLLLERNQLQEAVVQEGDILKILIPDIMANKIPEPVEAEPVAEEKAYTEEELELLAKIVMIEAGYESYEGQLAVANVILNRVADSRFPNSIREVIYAPNQFPPAHNGMLDAVEPNESSWKAAEAALNGENNVEGAVYFHNPKVTSGGFWSKLTVVATIGNHRFLK